MTADDKTSVDEHYQYLLGMQKRYRQATRQDKRALLDETVAHTGIHRESVIRRLNDSLKCRARPCERRPKYGPDFDAAYPVIWGATGYVHPERLTSNLLTTAELLGTHHELTLTPLAGRMSVEAPCLDLQQQRSLWEHQASINHLQLGRKVHRELAHLFAYPNAQPGTAEAVYQTGASPDRFPQIHTPLQAVGTTDSHSSDKEEMIALK